MNRISQHLLPELEPVHLSIPRSTASAESLPPAQKSRTLVPAVATALLLWACYFPLNVGWLGWVALVPMLCLVRSAARPRAVYFSAWAGGMVFYVTALQWIRVADDRMYATWIGLSIWCSFFTLAAIYLLRRLDQRTSLPLTVAVPLVWTSLEFARAHLLTGFPWYFLGHSQHDFLPLIQISDLGGAYAVTFLVAAVNGGLFELLYKQRRFRKLAGLPETAHGSGRSALMWQFALLGLMLSGTLGYGVWRLSQHEFEKGPTVALLQGNLDQRIKNLARGPDSPEEIISRVQRHYSVLCDEAADTHPTLIVWPETSFLYNWEEVSPGLSASQIPEDWKGRERQRARTAKTAGQMWGTNILIGVNAGVLEDDGRQHRYNSAALITAEGQITGRYDKMHCVPFGEYVPLRDWIPWMNKLAPYDFDYSVTPGKQFTRFPLGQYRFGVVICYEDTDPTLARRYVCPNGTEPQVDFLLNISNDGWFNGTSEHEQHLAICRFRAIECRRAVGRAVNMGISAVLDGNGNVVALPKANWESSKKVEAIVRAAIPIDHRRSLYAQWGDWLPWGCWLVVGVGIVLGSFLPNRPAVVQNS